MIWVLVVLGTLLLALAIPVRAIVLWRTKSPPRVTLRWLFLKYEVFPQQEKPQKAKREKKSDRPTKKKPVKKTPPAAKTPEDFAKQLGVVVDLLAAAKGALGFLIRRFRFYRIRLDMIVAREDAASTAIAYGRVNAAVYGAYAAAKNVFNLGTPEISIRPNFTAGKGDVKLEIGARLSPLAVLGAALRGGGSFLWRTVKRGRAGNKSEKQNVDQ